MLRDAEQQRDDRYCVIAMQAKHQFFIATIDPELRKLEPARQMVLNALGHAIQQHASPPFQQLIVATTKHPMTHGHDPAGALENPGRRMTNSGARRALELGKERMGNSAPTTNSQPSNTRAVSKRRAAPPQRSPLSLAPCARGL